MSNKIIEISQNPIITVYNYPSTMISSRSLGLQREDTYSKEKKRRRLFCSSFFIRNKRTSRANNGFGSSKKKKKKGGEGSFVNGPSNFQIMKRCASRLHASTINFSAAGQGGRGGGGGGGGGQFRPTEFAKLSIESQ